MHDRRILLRAIGVCLAARVLGSDDSAFAQSSLSRFDATLRDIERASGGRLGVSVLDTGTGSLVGHRMSEKFPLCSTFKLLASGALLARVDASHESLQRVIRYTAKDVVTYSPVTKDHVDTGLALADICEAAITLSDNTAGNLILDAIGGPEGLTAYLRSLGDDTTRLDRRETDLNSAIPGDPRDTTTPAAMAASVRKLVLGDALSPGSRVQLTTWLLANKTGGTRLRAGLPQDWRIGDKTGSGDNGATNDVGVIWPPGRAPLIVCVYLTETAASTDARNVAIASVGREVAVLGG